MNENILIISIHSSKNLGDEALLQVTLQQLKANFLTNNITLSIDYPTSHMSQERIVDSILTWVHPADPEGSVSWNFARLVWLLPATSLPILSKRIFGKAIYTLTPKYLKQIIQAYIEADLVICKPGGFLYSSGLGVNLLVAIYSIVLALMAGKPVYLFPQSIGPLLYPWEKLLLRWMLNRVRIVMIREPISYQMIQKWGLRNPRCYLIPDVAFALPSAGREVSEAWLHQHGINPQAGYPLLGMTVFNWSAHNSRFVSQDAYEEACAAAVHYFVEHERGRVIFFPQTWGPLVGQDDRIIARRIAKKLPNLAGSVIVVEETLSAELLKALYSWMDVFVGTRMHSNIFALSEGVPVIAIGYQHKTEGIAQMVGVDEWVINLQDLQADELVEKIKKLYEEREEWRVRIKEVIPNLVREAGRGGKIVADDFIGYIR
jgi:colanic acid/amylovoran biosynthesis protein